MQIMRICACAGGVTAGQKTVEIQYWAARRAVVRGPAFSKTHLCKGKRSHSFTNSRILLACLSLVESADHAHW